MKYHSRDDCKLIWKVILSEEIKTVIKEKKDLFQFCHYGEIDGFLWEKSNTDKVLLLFSNGTHSWVSTFISFDADSKIGLTRNGDSYQLVGFKPNEIVSAENEAIKMIQSWIK